MELKFHKPRKERLNSPLNKEHMKPCWGGPGVSSDIGQKPFIMFRQCGNQRVDHLIHQRQRCRPPPSSAT